MRVSRLVLAVVTLSACSGPSQSADPYASVDTFCSAKAQAECQVASRCAIPLDACARARTTACMQDATTAAAASRKYSAERAPNCLSAVKDVYSRGIVTPEDLEGAGSMSDKCERVYVGTVPIDAACEKDYECGQSAICAPVTAGGSSVRVCAVAIPKKLGDFCADPGSVCAGGSWCAPVKDGAPQCAAQGARGARCDLAGPVDQCAPGLRCTSPGLCDDRLPAGSRCTSSDDCAAGAPLCDQTLETSICDAGLSFAVGAPVCKQFGGQ